MEVFAQSVQWKIESNAGSAADCMAEASTDDQQLLRQLCRGNQAAFATVYERHQGQIYRFVLHMTGSRANAEEVTQEVFMLLIRKPKAYDPAKGSLAAYLFGVARNLARRAMRQDRDASLEDIAEVELPTAVGVGALDRLTNSEMLNAMRKALLALPELYREVVALCDLEEMSYAQAADVLDCSAGTVASRLHRAHAMLKVKLSRMAAKGCLPVGTHHG